VQAKVNILYNYLKQAIQAGLYFFTITEWGALLWLAPAWGIVIAYGMSYEFTNPMIVLLNSSWYFIWLLLQRYKKNGKSKYIYVNLFQFSNSYQLVRTGATSWHSLVVVILIIISLLGFGMYRTQQTIDNYRGINPYYVGATGIYTLRVTNLPEIATVNGNSYWHLTGELVAMDPQKETIGNCQLPAEGTIVAYIVPSKTVLFNKILPGQYIAVKGSISKTKFAPEEGRIDLRARYITDHRMGTLYEGDMVGLVPMKELPWGTKISNSIMGMLGFLRYECGDVLKAHLPGALGEMSQSLLLGGGYNSLDETIMDSFAKTGLIHILSVSGSHVALLFGFLFVVASWLGISKRRATYGAIIFVILYCSIVGYNPPVVRSALMGIIMGLGIIEGRLYQSRQALHISAAVLLCMEPLLLMDVSFQLSFGATYGILLFGRSIYQRLPKGWPYVMGPLSLCISAQLLIYPLQLYYFHLMGLGAFIAAILVGPILDLAILGAAILLLMNLIVDISLGWNVLAWLLKGALFLNFSIANIPGFVNYWGALTIMAGSLYILGCRFLYYYFSESRMLYWWREAMIVMGLMALLLLPIHSIFQRSVYVHIIPLSQGAAFLVVKEEPFKGRVGWLHVATEGKTLSRVSQGAIVNAVHYYGITKPQQISLGGVKQTEDTNLEPLMTSLHWSFQDLHKSQINEDIYIGQWTGDFNGIFEEQPNAVIARGAHGGFLFSNGQNSKKHLKLKEMKSYIVGTTNAVLATSHNRDEANSFPVLVYWSNGNKRSEVDVDPADENRYITGTTVIPDFLL